MTSEHTPDQLVAEEVAGTTDRVVPPESLALLPERVRDVAVVRDRRHPPPPSATSRTRGTLVPVGGRMDSAEIIDRFVSLCGGGEARLVVVPTASNLPDTGAWYGSLFRRHGAGTVEVLRLQRRGDQVDPTQLDLVRHATGVFFAGGNQLKLTTSILGTPLALLLQTRFAEGLHVGGTSAGAAFLSAHMIAFGAEGPVPRAGMVITCGGLGLTSRYLIDQHFRERGRLGRLLTAVAYNPYVLGLGVDENTAAFIGPDDTIEVVGEGAVTIVDPSGLDTSHLLDARPGARLALPGMATRVLTSA